MEPDRLQKRYRKKRSSTFTEEVLKRSKRSIPHIIYPEILVIVDYDGYRLHGGDNTQVSGCIFSICLWTCMCLAMVTNSKLNIEYWILNIEKLNIHNPIAD